MKRALTGIAAWAFWPCDRWGGDLDLGTVTIIPAPTPGATTAVAFNSRVTDHIVRVGLNYKFDAIWAYD